MELTKPQKLIYDICKYNGGAIATCCGALLLKKIIPQEQLNVALNKLFYINQALRLRLTSTGNVESYISEYKERQFEVKYFENYAMYYKFATSVASESFNLYGSLCDIKICYFNNNTSILIKIHHIISDAWTMALLGNQISDLITGKDPISFSYEKYIETEKKYLSSNKYLNDKIFWDNKFDICDEPVYLSDKNDSNLKADWLEFEIEKDTQNKLSNYSITNHTSIYMIILSVFGIYFSRIKNNAEKFYIGTATLNRTNYEEKNTVGMFINTVPVPFDIDYNNSFKEQLYKTSEICFDVFRHQRYNYGDIIRNIRNKKSYIGKLYDVLISYQNAYIGNMGVDCTSEWYRCPVQNETLQIHIEDRNNSGTLKIHYGYHSSKFNKSQITSLHSHFIQLLLNSIEKDTDYFKNISLLSEYDKNILLNSFNNTFQEHQKDKLVHQLFEEQVELHPDKTAVVACDKTLTYAELNEQANRIAYSLIEKGIKANDIVAFMLPRKSYLLSVMLGILKSGAAYMPIAPDYPQDRIDYMLSDSNAKFCITEDNIEEVLDCQNIDNPNLLLCSNNYCYCIYTSGSTGKPKGTVITHSNVANYVNNNNVVCKIIKNHYDKILSVTTVGFDIFVTESILPLSNGMCVLLANEQEAKFQSSLNSLVLNNNVDVMQTTPTKMKFLIADRGQVEYLSKLKTIILGGEALDKTLVDELKALTNAKIFNIYGPTEATVWVTNTEINNPDDINIGKPIANTQIYIVDKYMNILPIGVTGELCIAGDSVGVGYLNRPKLTAEKFIDNPFGEGKLYKTGDLAYWREDGNIAYVGRNDFQVKIRGLRIELGEIENAICSVDGINQSVVVVRKDNTGRQIICAFYTGKEIEAKKIRNSIGKTLPKYMIPHTFTYLDKMPLTSSGKANRNALPDVDFESISNNKACEKPLKGLEKQLCSIMSQVLGYKLIGLHDDFFDMGGDSLKAIEFVSKAHEEGIFFNLQNLFDYPTVKALCEYITNEDKQHITYDFKIFEKYEPILRKNKVENITVVPKIPIGNVLITGATGYLGSHIIDRLMSSSAQKIYCLVRNNEQRLWNTLRFYFGNKYDNCNRIIPIIGDLDSLATFDTPNLDMIIHTAASVKHYGSYQYFYDMNVKGTQATINLAKKYNAKLIHISTLSVSGNMMAESFDAYRNEKELFFDESKLFIEQPLDNIYARSKFEAEKAVFDAMLDGVQANIIRVGNLTNRHRDGKFQKNYESNAFLKRVKAILEFGYFPDYLMSLYVEFSPVDCTADAIVRIAEHFNNMYTVFNANSEKGLYFDKMFSILSKLGININVVSSKEFLKHMNTPETQFVYEALINDMDDDGKLVYDSNIRIISDFTVKYLQLLGFRWLEIDYDYLKKYIDYFRNIGYLEV